MSLYGKMEKQEHDYTTAVDEKLVECEAMATQGRVQDAIESLLSLEKQARLACDAHSTSRLLVAIVSLCYKFKNFDALNENIIFLTKRRSQLKAAVTKMVQECCKYVDELKDMTEKLRLIDTLRLVTDGKIYVEIERARLTKILATYKEADGLTSEAAVLMQELQVETYGSMEKREKIEFLLEQMRLCMLKGDFIRTQIISRKISLKAFQEEALHDLKLKFYELMIKLDTNENNYLNVCKHFIQIYETPRINENKVHMKEALKNICIYLLLSPYGLEQQQILLRFNQDKNMSELDKYKQLLVLFKTDEIINWKMLILHFEKDLKVGDGTLTATDIFTDSEKGVSRWNDFKSRIVEHNMRVMAKYYNRINTRRMSNLLDLTDEETEAFLSALVVNKTISGKVDRLTGIVTFEKQKDQNELLNDWSGNLNELMNTINKTTHLINKEEMVHAVKA